VTGSESLAGPRLPLLSDAQCQRCELRDACGGCLNGPCGVCDAECHIAAALELGAVAPDDRIRLRIWHEELGGSLCLDTRLEVPLTSLPSFIPLVKPEQANQRLPARPWYAVSIASVYNRNGKPITGSIRTKLGMPSSSKLLLVMHEKDRQIDRLWPRILNGEVANELRQMAPDLVLGPNYSVFLDQPRATHLLRMKESLVAVERLSAAGMPVVPNVYFACMHDVERWTAWLQRNPRVAAIAVNLQVDVSNQLLERLHQHLRALLRSVQRKLQVITVGPARPSSLARLPFDIASVVTVSALSDQVAARKHVLRSVGPPELLYEANHTERLAESLAVQDTWTQVLAL